MLLATVTSRIDCQLFYLTPSLCSDTLTSLLGFLFLGRIEFRFYFMVAMKGWLQTLGLTALLASQVLANEIELVSAFACAPRPAHTLSKC